MALIPNYEAVISQLRQEAKGYRESTDYENVPLRTLLALLLWRDYGEAPGGFLFKCLKNEATAILDADQTNRPAFPGIMRFIYNRIPADAWGEELAEGVENDTPWRGLKRGEGSDIPQLKKDGRYTLQGLEALDTIRQGQYDNLKLELENNRVYLSRLTVEDGEDYNNKVIVKQRNPTGSNEWETVAEYPAVDLTSTLL